MKHRKAVICVLAATAITCALLLYWWVINQLRLLALFLVTLALIICMP